MPVNLFAFVISFEARTLDGLLGSSWMMVITEILFIVTCNLLILIVRAIDARQEEKNLRVTRLGLFPSTPSLE